MKKLFICLLGAIQFTCLFAFSKVSDSVFFEDCDEETISAFKGDSITAITDNVHFDECNASVSVPEGFVFIDSYEARHLLIDYWNNVEDRAENLLGAFVPNDVTSFYQITVAYFISYSKMGYVKDDDANSVDYDELMKNIKESEKEENANLPEEQRLTTVGWEYAPKYLRDSHVLVWAKRIRSVGGDCINYDMRVLGKDGLVSLMAVIDPADAAEVKNREQSVIQSLSYDKGYAYADFDASRDRVSDWTIGGLVAGSILAKTGILAKIGIFLLKGWKIIAIAVAGIGGALFKNRKKKEEKTEEDK